MARKPKTETDAPKWSWTEGYPYKVAAQVAGQAIEDIKRDNGGDLTAQAVVDSSRPDDAPLHPAFEWRDPVAAEMYRCHQAKSMIRAICSVTVEDHGPTREYVGVKNDSAPKSPTNRDKTKYVTHTEVVRNPAMFADAMQRLQTHLHRAQQSVRELAMVAEAESPEPERMMRITLAVKAIEAASAAVEGLRH